MTCIGASIYYKRHTKRAVDVYFSEGARRRQRKDDGNLVAVHAHKPKWENAFAMKQFQYSVQIHTAAAWIAFAFFWRIREIESVAIAHTHRTEKKNYELFTL